jgi:hypothetical protein
MGAFPSTSPLESGDAQEKIDQHTQESLTLTMKKNHSLALNDAHTSMTTMSPDIARLAH